MIDRVVIAVIGALAAATFACVAAADEPARYSIKQDEPSTGTHIPRRIVETSRLPLNKRYQELTAEQQQLLKAQYVQMAEDDEPPFPANGLEPILKEIARGQQKLLVRGLLVMLVDVDANGTATSIKILQTPAPEMSRFVAAVLMLEKYKPAVCDGAPCPMQFPFRLTFRVR